MFQRWVFAFTAICIGAGAIGAAQDRATVQLRDGTKFEGRIEELTANGELFVRVSPNDQRRVPLGNVALIDKVGGASGLPATEVREAAGPEHLLMLAGGSDLKGQLLAIRGGEGSANENLPRTYVFRPTNGQERNFPPDQVARVYLGRYPFAATTSGVPDAPVNPPPPPTGGLDSGLDIPGGIRVAANAGWVTTNLRVRRGEQLSFTTTGEVQLSANPADRARSAGAPRMALGAPIPAANAGALIGRVGTGMAFGIGDQTSVPMPLDGVLFLAVNDDDWTDNSGAFVVSIARRR
jgi:hypothetical protein